MLTNDSTDSINLSTVSVNGVKAPGVAALDYLGRGWSPIWVPPRSKNPGRLGWQNERMSIGDILGTFNGQPLNVGVLLGTPSGDLVDIDFDCKEAVLLAPHFLPHTGARFGRPSRFD